MCNEIVTFDYIFVKVKYKRIFEFIPAMVEGYIYKFKPIKPLKYEVTVSSLILYLHIR